ncbi:hypothetical protein AVEN_207710-1 [Araneus ventricosus]|uniref:Uncharacterized protein n=1 Tax=Araneus ventricosus TaxID=182803 RepID=A0A4Y2PDJ6_ARAVE|nr:hypothetical protein AVEN_207710-1 [Araneus ventricosus]
MRLGYRPIDTPGTEMYHPSNGLPRTANTWGYFAVHEKQEANSDCLLFQEVSMVTVFFAAKSQREFRDMEHLIKATYVCNDRRSTPMDVISEVRPSVPRNSSDLFRTGKSTVFMLPRIFPILKPKVGVNDGLNESERVPFYGARAKIGQAAPSKVVFVLIQLLKVSLRFPSINDGP